ncbi:serine hydrolase domain-containing protein [Dokdonella soli]|uniref:Beta-lactamase-related domain-containing protein n=1 Tax=Dokdonella soli TaxID=529810 RepID=A0ABP3TPY3_9GAMM
MNSRLALPMPTIPIDRSPESGESRRQAAETTEATAPAHLARRLSLRRVLAVGLVFLLDGSAVAADRFDAIRQSIRTLLTQRQVPSVAVAVARNGRIVWEEGFGWADREKRIPATADTMYSLASVSKPLTATALMTLVGAGKVDLDKPVNAYLGSAGLRARIGDANDATVRRVANHSSGLAEHYQFFYANEPWRRPPFDEILRRYGDLVTPPGEHYQYSNLGYGILDYVIARQAGKSFADYMREDVFLPLGMTRSAVGPAPGVVQFEAVRYGHDGLPIPLYETDHDGASALYASAHDLARFGLFHLKAHLADQKAILPDSLIDAMHEQTMDEGNGSGYGIGWEIRHDSGYAIISHDGDMPGVRTELRLVPSERLVVVVLCNAEDRIAPMVADQIMGATLPKWKAPARRPESPSAKFTPPPDLVGLWEGKVFTYQSEVPITVQVLESGDIKIRLANQLESLLNFPRYSKDGFLRGVTTGSLEIDDATRRPYVLGLKLKLRSGNVLDGAITARADESSVMPTHGLFPSVAGQPRAERVQSRAFVLAQWTSLIKQ